MQESTLDPQRQEKAKEYARLKRCLSYVDLIFTGFLLLLLLFDDLSHRLIGSLALLPAPAASVYFLFLMVTYGILLAPLNYYRGLVLPRRYGLSFQKFAGWLGDTVKIGVLVVVLGVGVVAVVYLFMSSLPQIWWLLAWGFMLIISLVLTILVPVFIAPIFFKMEPLMDTELKERLKRLSRQAEMRVNSIYTITFSSKGTTANAALMGVGKTRRIVLSDTLLEQYSPAEIEVIIAHELGHQHHHDIFRLFVMQSAMLLVGFYVTNLILKTAIVPLGFSSLSDTATLPLLILILGAANLLFAPLINSFSRQLETAADNYALNLTNDPGSFISSITKLTDQNLVEARPNRWVEFLFWAHPSYRRRVEYARCHLTYKSNKRE
jgi:STE24 endopeptidase